MIWKLGRVSESRNASIAFIGLLLLVLASVCGWTGWRVMEVRETASWPTIEGRLIEAEVVEHHRTRVPGATRTSRIEYEAQVRYTYEVDGQTYESDRLRADTDRVEGERLWLMRLVAQLRAQRPLQVHYDPVDPGRSVLITDIGAGGWVPIVAWPAFVTLVIIALLLRMAWARLLGR